MFLLTSILLLASPACVTTCGLRFDAGIDCAGLQEMETRTLRAFEQRVTHWDYARTCEALDGWKIFIHKRTHEDQTECPEGGFWYQNNDKDCFAGYAHVFTREIELDNGEWQNNAIAHELVHVLQVGLGELIGHCFWKERGILRALKFATGRTPFLKYHECGTIDDLPRLR